MERRVYTPGLTWLAVSRLSKGFRIIGQDHLKAWFLVPLTHPMQTPDVATKATFKGNRYIRVNIGLPCWLSSTTVFEKQHPFAAMTTAQTGNQEREVGSHI